VNARVAVAEGRHRSAASLRRLEWVSGHRAVLGLLILVGLLLRLHAAEAWNEGRPNSPARLTLGDEPGYDNLARSLLDGRGFDWPGRVPLYPTFIAAIHAVSGYDYRAIPYAQAILATAVIPLTYLLGRELLGRGTGLLAAFGTALNIILANESGPVLSEVLYGPVLLVAILLLVRATRQPTPRRLVLAGAVMAAGALVRPMLFLFPLASLPMFWLLLGRRRGVRSWATYLAAAAIALAPWMIYTTARWNAVIPLQTSNAILWQGSPEYYHLVHDRHFRYLDIWTRVIYGPGWQRHDPTSVDGDAWWTRRALRSIESDPLTYVRFAGEKAGTYWIGDPSADWGDSSVFDYGRLRALGFTRVDALGTMAARILPVLALLCVVALWPYRRRLVPVYAVLLYATALAAATHAEARLSEPFQPVLAILLAGGLLAVGSRLTHGAIPAPGGPPDKAAPGGGTEEVGDPGLEPGTSSLSEKRSNRLS
jgi:4-amino-4-deoxy-L-arabinose transferase-like glycosyltransferase